jgi:hypothetical protein
MLGANRCDLGDGIDARRRCRADGRDNGERSVAVAHICFDRRAEGIDVHPELRVTRDAAHILLAKAERDRCLVDGAVRLIGSIDAEHRNLRAAGKSFARIAVLAFLPRGGERVHRGDRCRCRRRRR